jgi:hypothetical protein
MNYVEQFMTDNSLDIHEHFRIKQSEMPYFLDSRTFFFDSYCNLKDVHSQGRITHSSILIRLLKGELKIIKISKKGRENEADKTNPIE